MGTMTYLNDKYQSKRLYSYSLFTLLVLYIINKTTDFSLISIADEFPSLPDVPSFQLRGSSSRRTWNPGVCRCHCAGRHLGIFSTFAPFR